MTDRQLNTEVPIVGGLLNFDNQLAIGLVTLRSKVNTRRSVVPNIFPTELIHILQITQWNC